MMDAADIVWISGGSEIQQHLCKYRLMPYSSWVRDRKLCYFVLVESFTLIKVSLLKFLCRVAFQHVVKENMTVAEVIFTENMPNPQAWHPIRFVPF